MSGNRALLGQKLDSGILADFSVLSFCSDSECRRPQTDSGLLQSLWGEAQSQASCCGAWRHCLQNRQHAYTGGDVGKLCWHGFWPVVIPHRNWGREYPNLIVPENHMISYDMSGRYIIFKIKIQQAMHVCCAAFTCVPRKHLVSLIAVSILAFERRQGLWPFNHNTFGYGGSFTSKKTVQHKQSPLSGLCDDNLRWEGSPSERMQ